MALRTITYANKTAINTNASIPDTNKVNASDMNMIKEVVNENSAEQDIINSGQETTNNNLQNNKQDKILTGKSLPSTATNGTIFLLYS